MHPVTKEGYLFDEIKHKIRPLDLILFKGDEFVSKMIRKLERSKIKSNYVQYSHCALVLDRELLNDYRLDPTKLYVFESTCSGKYGNGINNIDGNAFLTISASLISSSQGAPKLVPFSAVSLITLITSGCA